MLRGFFRGTLRKLALLLLVATIVVIAQPIVKKRLTDDNALLRGYVRQLATRALPNHDTAEITRRVWLDYHDIWGNNSRYELEDQLKKLFAEYPVIEVSLGELREGDVQFDDAHQKAWVYCRLSIRGGKTQATEDLGAKARLTGEELAILFCKEETGEWVLATAARKKDLR